MSLPYRLRLSGNVKIDLSSVVFCRPARSMRITITQGSLQRNKMAESSLTAKQPKEHTGDSNHSPGIQDSVTAFPSWCDTIH